MRVPRPPLVSRIHSATPMPNTPNRPAAVSASEKPTCTGVAPGAPVSGTMPLMPSAILPKPGRGAYGPVWPKPVIESWISRGLSADSRSQPRPSRSSTPGR